MEHLPLLEERGEELLDLLATLEAVAAGELRALVPDRIRMKGFECSLDVAPVEGGVGVADRVGRGRSHGWHDARMGRLALATGTGTRGSEVSGERIEVETRSGAVGLIDAGSHVVLQRHGLDRYTPPHLIDHVAHFEALAALGCDRVLAVSSVGGLRRDLAVGSVLCPDDFIALHLGLTSRDDERGHAIAGFDPEWRRTVLSAWNGPVADGGTYWQAIGPRLETAAEIRMIAAHADVIGMTVASECIVAGELGMAYAAVCTVDNLANGARRGGPPARRRGAGRHGQGRPGRPLLAAIESAVRELAA